MSHIVQYELLGCVNNSSTPFSGSCSLTLWHLILAWTNLLWRLSCQISLLKSADLLCSGIVLFLDSWWLPVTLCKEVGRLLWGSFSYLSSTYLLLQPKGEILPTLLFNVLYYWHSQKVGKKKYLQKYPQFLCRRNFYVHFYVCQSLCQCVFQHF